MRACVVIPAYNAAKTLGPLVRQIRQMGLEAVVVDDGSTDQTARVATEAGMLVISHLGNQGKGAAVRSGFAFALQGGYDAVVTLDSDGQHDPREIPRLLQAISSSRAAVVVGNRLQHGTAMPRSRRWTNRVMSWIVSVMTRQPIPDSQCGLRVIRREALGTLQLSCRRFEIETEVLLEAARRGWLIASVPIQTIYDGHPSHICPVRDGVRFLRLIARHLWARSGAWLRAKRGAWHR